MVGNVRKSLWVLQGAVGFVLLIACANLANLLRSRRFQRGVSSPFRAAPRREPAQNVGQFVTEGIVISVLAESWVSFLPPSV
jgi:hypothetical protein